VRAGDVRDSLGRADERRHVFVGIDFDRREGHIEQLCALSDVTPVVRAVLLDHELVELRKDDAVHGATTIPVGVVAGAANVRIRVEFYYT
jgi:hypothetical protein